MFLLYVVEGLAGVTFRFGHDMDHAGGIGRGDQFDSMMKIGVDAAKAQERNFWVAKIKKVKCIV